MILRGVGAGGGLGHAHRLQAQFAARDLRQVAPLLLLEPWRISVPILYIWPWQAPELPPAAVDLLHDHRGLGQAQPRAAILLRDQRRHPAGLGQRFDEGLGIAALLVDLAMIFGRKLGTERADRTADLVEALARRRLHKPVLGLRAPRCGAHRHGFAGSVSIRFAAAAILGPRRNHDRSDLPAAGLARQAQQSKKRRKIRRLHAPQVLRLSGAGEGIRTLDPNLGKVVLYPELHPHPRQSHRPAARPGYCNTKRGGVQAPPESFFAVFHRAGDNAGALPLARRPARHPAIASISAFRKRYPHADEQASTPDELCAHLAERDIALHRTDHPAVFTVAETAPHRDSMVGHHTKNLFLKDKKGRLFLVSAEAHARIDLKRLHETLGASGAALLRLGRAADGKARRHAGLGHRLRRGQ